MRLAVIVIKLKSTNLRYLRLPTKTVLFPSKLSALFAFDCKFTRRTLSLSFSPFKTRLALASSTDSKSTKAMTLGAVTFDCDLKNLLPLLRRNRMLLTLPNLENSFRILPRFVLIGRLPTKTEIDGVLSGLDKEQQIELVVIGMTQTHLFQLHRLSHRLFSFSSIFVSLD